MTDGFSEQDEKFIQEIYDSAEDREHAEQLAQALANADREIQRRFHMSPAEFMALDEETLNRLLAEDKASEQRINKSQVDVEEAPLSPAELSDEQRAKYNKLVEFSADPVKALAWLEKHSTGTFDDYALKAVSDRLLSDDKLRANAEGVEAKRLLKDYFSELMANGLPTADIQDYFEMELTRSQAREAISRDKAIKAQEAKEADAIEKAKIVVARGTFVKWVAENRKLGIETNLEVCAEKLGVDKKDLKGLL